MCVGIVTCGVRDAVLFLNTSTLSAFGITLLTPLSVVPAPFLPFLMTVAVVVVLEVGGVAVQQDVAVVVEPVEDPEPCGENGKCERG
jgi:hypothetical protein